MDLGELPPKKPEVVEPVLSLLDEAAGLLPPNIELPAPVGLFPPTGELGGLLLVLGLLSLPPIGVIIYHIHFEKRRWADNNITAP